MRPVNEIIVHCSATRADWMAGAKTSAKVAEIRRWHVQDRGWRDIGYHLLIDRDGTVAKGRPMEQVGAHVQGKNTGTIGVCLMGGHGSSEKDKFADHFTPQQEAALRKVLADLMRQYPTITKVSGHNQYAAKACPGFNVPSWYAAARASLTRPAPQVNETPKSEHDRLSSKPVAASKPADPVAKPNAHPNAQSFAQWLVKFLTDLFTARWGRK